MQMEKIQSKLEKGGLLLAAISILAMLFSIFNYEIRLLGWIDICGNDISFRP